MAVPGAATPEAHGQRDRPLRAELAWVLAFAALGFTLTAALAGLLQLPRDAFVAVYAIAVASLLVSYVRWAGLEVRAFLTRRWAPGVIGAVAAGGLMAASVQRMAASPAAGGAEFAWDVLWLGVVYGVADAVLLNVLPVVAVWRAFAHGGRTTGWPGKLTAGACALAASLGITAAYHLGYPEFRGPQLVDPLIGNGIMTIGYLLTGSPVAAIGAHIALHVASVLHGVETTVTLPPHY